MDDRIKQFIDLENTHELNIFLTKNRINPTKSIKKNKSIKQPAPTDEKIEIKNHLIEIYLDKSNIHGYGVFTKFPINAGDTIEQCIAIELEFRDKYHKDQTILNYSYTIYDSDDESKKHGNKLILLTGYGMMYNHHIHHNAEWRLINGEERTLVLVAKKNISPAEEITIDYGPGYWKRINGHKN